MVLVPVRCLHCQNDHVIKGGKTKAGTQRYRCQSCSMSALFLCAQSRL